MINQEQIIFGIDPGFDRCGFAVLSLNKGEFRLIDVGCITTSKDLIHGERLLEVSSDLEQLLITHKPDLVGLEDLFFSKNVKTAMKVAEARGVILALTAKLKLLVVELNPNQIKLAVTGDGKADKRQVQDMVKLLLKLSAVPKPDDAADAVAVAISAATVNPNL